MPDTEQQALQVRPADEGSLPALARMQEEHPLFARYGVETAMLAEALSEARRRGDGILVAEQGTHPLGFAWWVEQGAFARSPYLRLLIVTSAALGRGVGSRLMEAIEGAAYARHHDLFLLVTQDNEAARRFYLGRGFEQVGVLHDYVRPGVHELIMRKRRPALTG